MGKVIGIIVVLAIAILFAVLTCRSKQKDLYKWIGIALFVAFALSWIIPAGSFSEGKFYESGMNYLGLTDISTVAFYAIYFCLSTVLYFLALGGFYGVISKTDGYSALVKKCSKLVKKKTVVSSIVIVVLLVALTSILRSTLALIVFVPFIISILLNANFDKINAMGVTFGSILVGTLAATYGSEGIYWFNSYVGTDINTGLVYRIILSGIFLVLFILFTVLKVRKIGKTNKNSKNAEETVDLYEVTESRGKTKVWPTIVVLSVIFILIILGYVDWATNFGIEVFNKFHEWLTTLTIGKEFAIFKYILGTGTTALGTWEITVLTVIVLIATIITAIINNVKGKEFASNFGAGLGKILKPVSLYALAFAVFVTFYMTQCMAFISDWFIGLTSGFNPFITTISAFISSIFHADLGYTGYIVGSVLTNTYANDLNLAHTLYVSTYGLVQVLVPTSSILLFGLSYMNIDYKSWFKYIWMFALVAFAAIMIFAAIVQYAL